MPYYANVKYSFSINAYETHDSHYCIFTKGSPERIWHICANIQEGEKAVFKSELHNKKF